jgi:hypothetical protein
MKRTLPLDGCRSSSEIVGELYALDRRLPFGERLNGLARFRGGRWAVTRWLTGFAPRLAELSAWTWRARPAAVLDSRTPFLLCLTRESLREGLRLLVAEWMEFRRAAPGAALDLVLRACPPSSGQSTFDFVAQYWEQVQALKRQLGVRRAGVYLWVRDADDAGDEELLDRARALVVVARGQSFADPLTLALRKGKPVIAPRDEELPPGYPFAFATRPAVLRFLGEIRRLDTSSVPWPIPEALELARAIERLAKSDDLALAEAIRQQSEQGNALASVHQGEESGVRGS